MNPKILILTIYMSVIFFTKSSGDGIDLLKPFFTSLSPFL